MARDVCSHAVLGYQEFSTSDGLSWAYWEQGFGIAGMKNYSSPNKAAYCTWFNGLTE